MTDLPPRIPPDAYERLAALRETAVKAQAAAAAGDGAALDGELLRASWHWAELVRLHHPELLPCLRAPVSSG